ncbi:MAG: sensor histidine kinase [Acidimicrobiia bacterium]|nr:sensor histidine kinase [Acidimicrobiia bacterium]
MADSPTLGSWETWMDRFFVWSAYVGLAISSAIALIGRWDEKTAGLAVLAALWTWLVLSRAGRPTELSQWALRIYLVGFFAFGMALMWQSPVFLVYGISGFYHAALLRPWWTSFVGVTAASLVVHATIIINDRRLSAWLIYGGIVAIQTAAVWIGLYGGARLTDVADERKRTVQQLEETLAENVGLHAQLVAQAREAGVFDERQRMAREIHDTIAQGLTGVITQIEAAEQSWGDESELRRHLDLAQGIARDSLEEARRSVQAIRPGPLERSRLPDAIAEVVAQWSDAEGVEVEVHTTGEPQPLHPDVEVTLLRATQEALANVAKHAGATRVGVTLSFLGRAVALDVRDDGVGFDAGRPTAEGHYGLAAMRQRVEDVKGVMEVESAPGEGTAIAITIETEGAVDE